MATTANPQPSHDGAPRAPSSTAETAPAKAAGMHQGCAIGPDGSAGAGAASTDATAAEAAKFTTEATAAWPRATCSGGTTAGTRSNGSEWASYPMLPCPSGEVNDLMRVPAPAAPNITAESSAVDTPKASSHESAAAAATAAAAGAAATAAAAVAVADAASAAAAAVTVVTAASNVATTATSSTRDTAAVTCATGGASDGRGGDAAAASWLGHEAASAAAAAAACSRVRSDHGSSAVEEAARVEKPSRSLSSWLKEGPFVLSMAPGFFGFFAHIGALIALEDAGLLQGVSFATGASAGGLVAGLFAAGLSPADMGKTVVKFRRGDFWDPVGFGGLLRGKKFEDIVKATLPAGVRRFDQCRVPLAVSAFDLSRLTTRTLEEGSLAQALRATCTFPGLFAPVWHEKGVLIDGGLRDTTGMWCVPEGLESCRRVLNVTFGDRDAGGVCVPPSRFPTASNARPTPDGMEIVSLALTRLPRPHPFAMERGADATEAARSQVAAVLEMPLLKGREASHWIAATVAAQPPPAGADQDDGSSSSIDGDGREPGKARVEAEQAGSSSSSSSSSSNSGCSSSYRHAAAAANDGDSSCTAAASRATWSTGATAEDGATAARGVAATAANKGEAIDVTSCPAAAYPVVVDSSGSDVIYGPHVGESPATGAARPAGRDGGQGGPPATRVASTAVPSPESTSRGATTAFAGLARTNTDLPVRAVGYLQPVCGEKEAGALPVSVTTEAPAPNAAGEKRFRSSGVSCPRESKKTAKGLPDHDGTVRDGGGGVAAVGYGSGGGSGSGGAGADEAMVSPTSLGERCKREHPAGREGEEEEKSLPARASESAKRLKVSPFTG